MKRILLGVILLGLVASFGDCQDQPLQLTISSDKQVYEVEEEIKLDAMINNTSAKSINVEDHFDWNKEVIFRLKNEYGEECQLTYIGSIDIVVPTDLSSNSSFRIWQYVIGWLGEGRFKWGSFKYKAVSLRGKEYSFKGKQTIAMKGWGLTSNTITIEVAEKSNVVKPACPKCRLTKDVVPIQYGLPGPELMEQAERGEVELGGCMVYPNAPEWSCKACEHRW